MANPFVHVELTTTDSKRSKEFYGKLFDWRFEEVPVGIRVLTRSSRSGKERAAECSR